MNKIDNINNISSQLLNKNKKLLNYQYGIQAVLKLYSGNFNFWNISNRIWTYAEISWELQ
jgi:hypothetical protein